MKNALFARFALLTLLVPLALTASLQAARPNIVLIMVDDFGYECVGANGGESYRTPNLDALAASGMRFENCHVQPLCTPTRAQLMTGRYNVRNYVNFGTLLRSETTFGNLFKQAGYATGVCGKWQLGHQVDSPQHFGFDESCLWQHTRRPVRYANPGLEYNGKERDFHDGEYGPDLVNNFALEFIEKHRAEPFFLYYPMILTHDPFQPTPDSADWDPKTNTATAQNNVKHFADMTAHMDKLVGVVISKLESLGLRENTLFMVLGDNGTSPAVKSRFKGAEYAGGKGRTTANGTHVPLIASWPAVIKQPRVCSDLVSSTDFLPTICEAAGVKVPANVDGVSFAAQLRGENPRPREWLYSWYSPRLNAATTVREYAFDTRYKLYRTGEFFDLARDVDEKTNLAGRALEGPAAAAKEKLELALDQFKEARPPELDRLFEKAAKPTNGDGEKKRKKKA
jgi:arylsulfatase A